VKRQGGNVARKVLKARWVRAIGAAVTLAGVTVVLVVLILPTAAFGSSKRRSSPCKSIDVTFSPSSAKANDKSRIWFSGQQLGFVEKVMFTARKSYGSHWVDAHSFGFSGGKFYATVPTDAGTGKIAIGASSDPDACALTYTTKTFHTL
jgi:hypothetical protein